MPVSPSDIDVCRETHVYVHLANHGGGWVLLVERNGQIVSTLHCTDWHRVERRRKLLEATDVWAAARVTALLILAAAFVP